MLKFSKDIYAFFLRRRRRSFSKKVKLVTLKVEVYRDWKFSLFSPNEQSFRQVCSAVFDVCCWWLFGGGWDGKMYVVVVSFLLSIQPVLIATVVVCLRSDPSRKSRTRQEKATRKLAHSLRFANTKKDYRFFLWFFWKINFFDVFNFIIFFVSHSLEHVIIQHSTLSFT